MGFERLRDKYKGERELVEKVESERRETLGKKEKEEQAIQSEIQKRLFRERSIVNEMLKKFGVRKIIEKGKEIVAKESGYRPTDIYEKAPNKLGLITSGPEPYFYGITGQNTRKVVPEDYYDHCFRITFFRTGSNGKSLQAGVSIIATVDGIATFSWNQDRKQLEDVIADRLMNLKWWEVSESYSGPGAGYDPKIGRIGG